MGIVVRFEGAINESVQENLRLLVVDDDLPYAHLLTRYLKQIYIDSTVDICNNPQEAMQLCLRNNYCVVLVDYNLGDTKGSDFLRQLHLKIDGVPPPAIVLTADGGVAAARDALKADAYDFMPKEAVSRESLARSTKNAITKHQLSKSIIQRTEELEKANRTLREQRREISEFYQTVSHEVKTPLAAGREFISLVRDGVLGAVSDDQAEALDHALASCDQISSHFNDLVEMMRIDASKITLHRSHMSVQEMIKRTIASCSRSAQEADITITPPVDFEACNASLNVDGDRIIQVLSNLLSNAVKYTPENGEIKISYNFKQQAIRFCVADSGCGIDAKHIDDIFNRLFQVSEGNHEYAGAGLGLGLSIAREIVHLHGGRIWAESQVGNGSQFYVELPVTETTPHTGYSLPISL